MDALNLAQKVYNMLNRIAVSGGTYRDWLETVFTGGEYMERCETPVFEGGTSQEIVFQEVISNSATEQDYRDWETDRKSTRLNSSHRSLSRMPSSA